MPQDVYSTASATATAAAQSRFRRSPSTAGEGHSSSTFWCALALPHSRALAARVADDLDLDVARALDELLGVDRAVVEEELGFRTSALEGGGDVPLALDPAHALAAPAGRSLEQDRIAGLPAERLELRRPRGGMRHAGYHGHACLLHELPAAGFRAHRLDRLGRRPDERQVGVAARLRKRRVLSEESVARVNERRTSLRRRGEKGRHGEIALARRRGPESDGMIRRRHMRRAPIGVREDRDCFDS